MIFLLREIQEKCIEQNMPLYMIFVDFTLTRKLGCLDQFTNLISALHAGMKASVNLKGDLSAPLEITNKMKQGCVLAPTLFLIYLTMDMNQGFDGHHSGVWVQTRPGADFSTSIISNPPPKPVRYSSENSCFLTTLLLLPITTRRLKRSSLALQSLPKTLD